jgi:hypothetical protein
MNRHRRALRNSISAEARAYGFSLVVLTTGYLCVDDRGLPGARGALAFLGGALLAQALVATVAFEGFRKTWSGGEDVSYYAPTSVHLVSVVAGVFAGWGLAALVHRHVLAYFLAAFGAVLVYTTVLSIELALGLAERPDE